MTHPDLKDIIARALGPSIDGTILAAVSGGPDSMAMFHALCELARGREGLRVVAGHFDHRLRADSADDRKVVEQLAGSYGVRVVGGGADVVSHARASRQSFEAAARELRYELLERAADEAGADLIATAHTRTDQVETVLMRVLHGAGARGRRGIPHRRGRIVRPLLSCTRADTDAYCRLHDIAFVIDSSNLDVGYERNRLRHEVLPALRCAYPGLDDTLLRIAAAARDEFDRAERIVGNRVRQFLHREADGSWLLDVDAFTGLDHEDCLHLVSATLDAMNARTDVSALHHEMLYDLLAADVGAISYLPRLRVRRDHDGLHFAHPGHALPRDEMEYALTVPGRVQFDGWEIVADDIGRRREIRRVRDGATGVHVRCGDALTVRYARPGDRMQPFGMSGHKKLSDIFIDRKVPHRKRARTPVVEREGEILWVVGVAASEATRVHAGTSGLMKLTATFGGAS